MTAARSTNLSAWTDDPSAFVMPATTNILQADQAMGAQAFFLRLRRDEPSVTESPELMALPMDGPWTDAGPPEPEAPVGEPVVLPGS